MNIVVLLETNLGFLPLLYDDTYAIHRECARSLSLLRAPARLPLRVLCIVCAVARCLGRLQEGWIQQLQPKGVALKPWISFTSSCA